MKLNRLLEGTPFAATTMESTVAGVRSCTVTITRHPSPKQILKSPKVVYETTQETWDDACADCESWIEKEAKMSENEKAESDERPAQPLPSKTIEETCDGMLPDD